MRSISPLQKETICNMIPKDEIKQNLSHISERLDKLDEKMDENNRHLQEHMSRTALNEMLLQNQKEHFEFRHDMIERRMEKQEEKFNSLPVRVLQFVSIVGGIITVMRTLL